jgi:hypothetical protein
MRPLAELVHWSAWLGLLGCRQTKYGAAIVTRFTQRPVARALLWFAAWMLLGFSLIQSLQVAVDWWYNQLLSPGLREWFWLLLLPVLIGIYLRFFSIFRPGCEACQFPETPPQGRRHG